MTLEVLSPAGISRSGGDEGEADQMSDIVERLREEAVLGVDADMEETLYADAAAEIERLRGLLREILEDGYMHVPYGASHEDVSAIRDFEKRVCRAVLGEPE